MSIHLLIDAKKNLEEYKPNCSSTWIWEVVMKTLPLTELLWAQLGPVPGRVLQEHNFSTNPVR